MKKRGQITIFIIIGLVILIGAAIAVYFYQTSVTAPIKRIVTVPEQVQQVYDYVATCIDQIGKDGLVLLGTQGGYIFLPPGIERNRNTYLAADAAKLVKTPFWYYEGEDRTPTLDFMQRELALYVKQNLPDCVGTFESLRERFDITPVDEILPIVTFTDRDAIIEIKWPLDIRVQNSNTRLNQFISQLPVRIKPMFELAKQTMDYENKHGWFENLTIDLMSANPRIPLSGLEFSCGEKKWHITQVKKELQTMLYYNLPTIRVANTQYPAPLQPESVYARLKRDAQNARTAYAEGREYELPQTAPSDAYQFNRMMLDVGSRKSDLKTAFEYHPEWNLLINAQPNKGGILSSASVRGPRAYLRFLCINQWHFAYDVIYPVRMTIKDDTAFQNEGNTFTMAFPVIIEDNEESRTVFGLRKFQTPDVGLDFCTTFGTQQLDARALGFVEGSPFAEELSDATITYRCLNQECKLGTTYSDGFGAIRLLSYLPEGCSNPLIIANKNGYLPAEKQYTPGKTELLLTKLQNMNFTLLVHPYYETVDSQDPTKATNKQWLDNQVYSTFTKTMHAIVTISVHNESFDQFKNYPAEFSTTAAQIVEAPNTTIDFVYGDAAYDIDILLFKGDTPIGGYHAENLSITYDEIAGNNNVIFHVVEYRPLPDTGAKQAGMYLFLYERGTYTDGKPYWDALRPTFTP